MGKYNKHLGFLFLFLCGGAFAKGNETEISAMINDDIGCEIRLPSSLEFTPQRTSAFQGVTTTYEIKPLRAQLLCVDKTAELTPKLTLEGNTPYSENSIFLDGIPNSVGFMLRVSDGTPISLGDFFQLDKAIKRGEPVFLTPLNLANHHQVEEIFLVGLVGPIDGNAVPGKFSAALTFNLIFQ
ncbi:fimbrial protein [Providencia stuartii]|uniref:fimbrial protein n=1 Tax=Providencia stuartii TaxID=588 RepID=UPI0033391434